MDWGPRRAVRFVVTTVVLVLALGAALPAGAAVKHRRASAVLASISTANQQVVKIAKSKFARGKRAGVLAAGRRAIRLARGKRSCRTLAAADFLLNSLSTPATWKHRRVPRGAIRKPLGQLGKATKALLKKAGTKCAAPAKTRRLTPHIGGIGSPKVAPPRSEPEQGDGLNKGIPQGKLILPKTIGGTSSLRPDLHGVSPARDPFGRIASDTFSFFRNSDVGIPPRQASPMEPTTAVAPGFGVAWYTGNTSDGLSTDNGRTWTRFDPSNVLPDQGLPYCCDQVVSYSPSYNIFVWISQYWCNTGGCFTSDSAGHTICRSDSAFNRIRIAVASPQALKANASNPGRAWTYWDVTPGLIGQPSNAWFDRSDMSVNAMNMNWGVDILCGRADNLVSRISLAGLAARGTVSLNYTTAAGARTTAQGLGTSTTYFAGSNSFSQAKIWSWAPYSGTLFRHDINHSTVPIFNAGITGSDGGNWYDRFGIFPGEVESATVSGNTLYLAQGTGRDVCTANCSSSSRTLSQVLNQPSIFVSKYGVSSWNNVGERWLWNPTLAFGWPAMATDASGDVGIVFRTSTANHNAQPVAGFLTPSEQFFFADPEGRPYETGDYYSLRPGRTDRSFVMTSQTVQNDPGGSAMHWFYVEYGLGTPPYVSPPDVHITSPANLSSFTQATNVPYTASVSDPIDGTLPAGAIRWTEDGTSIGSGASISHVESSLGTHVITVTATNGDGKSASDSITIRVNPPPSPLHVTITNPPDGSTYSPPFNSQIGQYCQSVQFTSTVTGGQGPVSFLWSDIRTQDNNPPQPSQQVSTQQNPTLTLCGSTGFDGFSTHDLTLTVSDGAHTAAAQVRVTVLDPIIG
ncbi:MAG: hypothetical protein QOD66_1205 [Solirubrobacteraceae bacterium]|jgi:hypothetical protein|nr:hypothetical protein [Solirubrobacteraceae bacterium]